MIHPHITLVGPCDVNAPRPGQYAAPPLGVHRMAAHARQKAGLHVSVIDPSITRASECLRFLSSTRPDLVGFSTLAPTMEADLQLLFRTRAILPEALLVMGGQGVAGLESLLVEQGGADIVVRGFGEETIISLAELLGSRGRRDVLNNSRLADIPNVTVDDLEGKSYTTHYAAASAEVFHAANEALDFTDIPYPLYWEANRQRYPTHHVRLMRNEGLLNTIRLITQSHCPLGCNYCSSTRFLDIPGKRQKVLMQGPEEIIATMGRALVAHPATTAFYLNDDDFVLSRSRALEFAKLVCQRFPKRDLAFIAMTRVDHVNKEMAEILAQAGFRLIFLGVETFSPHTLVAMEKNLRDQGDYTGLARQTVLTLLDAGIVPQIGLIPFYPAVREGDLLITIENTVDLVAQGARLSLFPMTDAYPGASLYNSGYEVSTKEIRIGKHIFPLPVHFLPEDPTMRDLAAKSIKEYQYVRKTHQLKSMPQPVDGLYFLRIILRNIGHDTSSVDRVLRDLEGEKNSITRLSLQYMNA